MIESHEPENNWFIETIKTSTGESRIIKYALSDKKIDSSAYNSALYTPIVIAPLSKVCAFIISAFYKETKLCLCLHDLRIVNNEIVNSFTFLLRGNDYQLKKLKNELNRFCDNRRCIGLSFLFRKMFNTGFHTIYAEKILKPKTNSSLKSAVRIVQSANNTTDYDEIISSIGAEYGNTD